MIENFYDNKYCIWQIDLNQFFAIEKLKELINKDLIIASTSSNPQEARGKGYSTFTLMNLKEFRQLLEFLSPSINKHLQQLGLPINKKLLRAWANRVEKNCKGVIHKHNSKVWTEQTYVLILYLSTPAGSGDLTLIHPKYNMLDVMLASPDVIPESDKFRIKVSEGMCVMHDGELLHAVSETTSDEPRDCIVLEFKCF